MLGRKTDGVGNVESTTVTVINHAAPVWPQTYTADWSTATSVTELGVPLDGRWTLDPVNGTVSVEIADQGYDRILLIGDDTWTDYELTASITLRQINPTPSPLSGRAGFGYIVNWNGHNDTVAPGSQPLQGYLPDPSTPTPFGAITWWRNDRIGIFDHNATSQVEGTAMQVTEGATYRTKLQVDRQGLATTYRYKMWVDGAAEPTSWDAVFTSPGGSDEPLSGSVGLLAHEVAASHDVGSAAQSTHIL